MPFRPSSISGFFIRVTFSAALLAGSLPAIGAGTSEVASAIRKDILPNGMKVLYVPSHNAPIIASVVVIQAGSIYETPALSGASHFLEHLLFNGTETMSQDELYDATDRIGAYSNATTGQIQTTFMMVTPRKNLSEALRIQKEMLYHSILPAEKLEKERGIILEELAKDKATESYDVERFLKDSLYPTTSYGLPVLGTSLTIEQLTRDQIWDYYKQHYIPQTTTVMIIGDFDPETAPDSVTAILGSEPPVPFVPSPSPLPESVVGRKVIHFNREMSRGHLTIAFSGPSVNDPDRLAVEAGIGLLAGGSATPVGQALEALYPAGILSFGTYLREMPGAGRIEVSVEYDKSLSGDTILESLLELLPRADIQTLVPAAFAGWQTDQRTQEFFQRERPHFYGMLRAPTCAVKGAWAVAESPEQIRSLTWAHVQSATSGLFSGDFWAAIVEPGVADTAQSGAFESNVHQYALDNGLRIAVLQRRESPVLALHLLTLGRAELEPPGRDGLTELVHGMLEEGVNGGDAQEFQQRLSEIGGELKVVDIPYIPFDDSDTRPDYAYLRLQSLDEFGPKAFRLFGDILRHPTFSEEAFNSSQAALMARAARDSRSAAQRATQTLDNLLYGSSPAGRQPFGSTATLQSATYEEAKAHWERLSDPARSFLSIATAEDPETILHWIVTELYPGSHVKDGDPGAIMNGGPATLEIFWDAAGDVVENRFNELLQSPNPLMTLPWGRPTEPNPDHLRMVVDSLGAERGYVLIAALLTGIPDEERYLYTAWNTWVSDRLAFVLREEMGMAYGIGSSLAWLGKGRALWIASAGTRQQNLEAMTKGLLAGPQLGLTDPPTMDDLEKAVAGRYGYQLMRRGTSLKRTMFVATSILYGKEPTWDEEELERFGQADPERVKQLAEEIAGRKLPTLVVIVE